MKLVEKILSNKEYSEKVAAMTAEEFMHEIGKRGFELEAEKAVQIYQQVKLSVAGGELDDDQLDVISGGWASNTYLHPNQSGC